MIWNCMNRREMLRLMAATGAFILNGGPMSANELTPSARAVDHLLLGVSDLNYGIQWVEDRAGIKAVVGGVHPGMGTRNALLSLGGKRYLEIIAPDPAQDTFAFPIDVRKFTEPKLITWASSTSDIDQLAKRAITEGFQAFGPTDGSRNRPDGKTLHWKTLFLQTDFMDGSVNPFPFFIQWAADSLHPSQDSPPGCELKTLVMEHPRPDELKASLEKLWITAEVRKAETARLLATIRTPKGDLILD